MRNPNECDPDTEGAQSLIQTLQKRQCHAQSFMLMLGNANNLSFHKVSEFSESSPSHTVIPLVSVVSLDPENKTCCK
jgi:hypothetical protein